MKYVIEDILTKWDEVFSLAEEAWNEVDQMKVSRNLDPDRDLYTALNAQGMIRLYNMYTEDNELVGFAIYIINPSLHCKGEFDATSDVIYIKPEYRNTGKEFLQLIIDDLKEEGVTWFSLIVKAWLDNGKLAKAIHCDPYETTYQRSLK